MTTLKRHSSSSKGFTLVEMLLSVVLFSIVAFSVFHVIQKSVESLKNTSEIEEGLANARIAVERMQYELSRLKTTDILSISSNKISFTDKNLNQTSFEFDSPSSELRRGVNLLLPKTQSLQFSYFDQNGNTITNMSQIQNLKTIQWTLNLVVRDTTPYALKGRIFLRSTQYTDYQ